MNLSTLDTHIHDTLRRQHTPGFAIGIVQSGELIYAGGFGQQRLGDPTHVTPRTNFHMASITKTMVAVAVLQLAGQGKLALDDAVSQHVPYFPLSDSITVRHLLTHTSGLPQVRDYEWDRPSIDDDALARYVRRMGDVGLESAPGTEYHSSDRGYEILGNLIACVSNIPFEQYMQWNILQPLAMHRSTLMPLHEANKATLASPHDMDNSGNIVLHPTYPYNRIHAPSSNLCSSVEDMTHWMLAQLNGGELRGARILPRDAYQQMWKGAVETGKGGHYGLGWHVSRYHNEAMVSHSGADIGFAAHLALLPVKGIGVVAMANCHWSPPSMIANIVLDLLLDEAPETLTPPDALPHFAGQYTAETGAKADVFHDGEELYLIHEGHKRRLQPVRRDVFVGGLACVLRLRGEQPILEIGGTVFEREK